MQAEYVKNVDENFEAVIFAAETSERFEVQRQLEPSKADVAAGQDTYCLVTASGATHYGGVSELSDDDNGVEFRFTDEASETLGIPQWVRVDLDESSLEAVREPLRRMLR